MAFTLAVCNLNAQPFQIKDLSNSFSNWEGTLTYMDYVTGKPFTMLANIKIGSTSDQKGYIMEYAYPKEPHANSKDTTFVNGKLFGKDKVVGFLKEMNGDFTLVTEMEGQDGNDNKKAILKHTYLLKENKYTITKEVKFEGTEIWIKRNEYTFNRAKH